MRGLPEQELRTIQVTWEPAAVKACTTEGGAGSVEVVATLSYVPVDEEDGTQEYMFLTEEGDDFRQSSLIPLSSTDKRLSFSPQITGSLGLGPHVGTLTFQACTDYSCSRHYPTTGATVAYTVDVTPPLAVSLAIDGVPAEGSDPLHTEWQVTSGQTVTLTTNLPAIFEKGSAAGDADIHVVSKDDTSWTGTVTGSPGEFVGIDVFQQCGVGGGQVLFEFPHL